MSRLELVADRPCRACRRPVKVAIRWNGLEYVSAPVQDDGEGGLLELENCPHCGQGGLFLAPREEIER